MAKNADRPARMRVIALAALLQGCAMGSAIQAQAQNPRANAAAAARG